jgi:hypothetical protein
MPLQVGDVIRVMAHFVRPPKPKWMICICPLRFKYMVINTEPYQLALMAQLRITRTQVPFLETDSYVDTSKLVTLSAMETQYVVDADPRCFKGALPVQIRQAIKAAIPQHGIMPKDQMQIIATNL